MLDEMTSLNEEILKSIRDSKSRLQQIYNEVKGKEGINPSLLDSIKECIES